MTIVEEEIVAVEIMPARISWSAAFAGALIATSLALVLQTFGGAIGLAVSSTATTWRDASVALWILSGVYLMLVALASYSLGGYVAGWVAAWSSTRTPTIDDSSEGILGLLVWALATIAIAIVLGIAAISVTRVAAPSASVSTGASSSGNESIIAFDLDRLFRADGRASPADYPRARTEAGRILLTTTGHSGMAVEDRQYLVRLIVTQTGLSPADADRRVEGVISRATDNIKRARRSAVILAFMVGASALLGAAAAWFAAEVGGRHSRDPRLRSIWGGPQSVKPAP